jgi:hypothetical protein
MAGDLTLNRLSLRYRDVQWLMQKTAGMLIIPGAALGVLPL